MIAIALILSLLIKLAISNVEIIPIDCVTRTGTAAQGIQARSSISCLDGETLVSCGLRGTQGIGGTWVDSSDTNTCIGMANHVSWAIFPKARCCTFPDGVVLDTSIVESSSGQRRTTTCSSGQLTGCQTLFTSGMRNKLKGMGAGPENPRLQVTEWVDTNNQCNGYSYSGGEIKTGGVCLELASGYELECSTKSKKTNRANFGTCPDSDTWMSACMTFTNTNSLDAYFITNDDKCYVQQDDHVYQWANAICCKLVSVNVDECAENTHDCSPNADCEDTVDSFNCVCKPGFNDVNNDGRICEDIDECASTATNDCSSNARCDNLIGGDRGYECTCNPGYTDVDGDGTNCVDINECASSTSNDCSSYASCTNLIGGDRGYECTCDPGYTDVDGDGTNCVDFDECKAGIRTETGGFEFEDESKFHALIIPPDEISDIGWSSTGSVVQLRGIIESETKIIGKGLPGEESNQLVGRLSMEESFGTIFCPMVDQTFLVTNVKGLSISITITTECDLKVESWGLHKVYYDIKTQQFLRLENFYPKPRKTDTNYFHHCTDESPCDDDLDNDMDVIAIYEGSDGTPNQITVMHYFDLAGITYISNYMVVEDCIETATTASGHFAPEIDYNVIYGLYILVLGLYILILGLILWECRKCYINRKGNSPYSKVQVHYVDESSQITDVGVE